MRWHRGAINFTLKLVASLFFESTVFDTSLSHFIHHSSCLHHLQPLWLWFLMTHLQDAGEDEEAPGRVLSPSHPSLVFRLDVWKSWNCAMFGSIIHLWVVVNHNIFFATFFFWHLAWIRWWHLHLRQCSMFGMEFEGSVNPRSEPKQLRKRETVLENAPYDQLQAPLDWCSSPFLILVSYKCRSPIGYSISGLHPSVACANSCQIHTISIFAAEKCITSGPTRSLSSVFPSLGCQVSELLRGDALLLRLQKLPAEVFALSVALVRGRCGAGWKKSPNWYPIDRWFVPLFIDIFRNSTIQGCAGALECTICWRLSLGDFTHFVTEELDWTLPQKSKHYIISLVSWKCHINALEDSIEVSVHCHVLALGTWVYRHFQSQILMLVKYSHSSLPHEIAKLETMVLVLDPFGIQSCFFECIRGWDRYDKRFNTPLSWICWRWFSILPTGNPLSGVGKSIGGP